MNVRRGGARAQVLVRAWRPLRGFRDLALRFPRYAYALSESIRVDNIEEVPPPLVATAATSEGSEPTTPPPATPPRVPTPPAPIAKRWSLLVKAVPSYSHCFM